MFLKTPKEFLKIFWPQTFFATDFSEIVMSTQQNSRRGAAARNPVRLLRVQLGKPSRGESLWQQLAPSLNADHTTLNLSAVTPAEFPSRSLRESFVHWVWASSLAQPTMILLQSGPTPVRAPHSAHPSYGSSLWRIR